MESMQAAPTIAVDSLDTFRRSRGSLFEPFILRISDNLAKDFTILLL